MTVVTVVRPDGTRVDDDATVGTPVGVRLESLLNTTPWPRRSPMTARWCTPLLQRPGFQENPYTTTVTVLRPDGSRATHTFAGKADEVGTLENGALAIVTTTGSGSATDPYVATSHLVAVGDGATAAATTSIDM